MVMYSPIDPQTHIRTLWTGEPPQGLAEGVSAFAYVNHGRWVADCPSPGCNSAQMLHHVGQKYFCVECGNAAFSWKWIDIIWPEDIVGIEKQLNNRHIDNQNWFPGESTEMLKTENMQHGVLVLP